MILVNEEDQYSYVYKILSHLFVCSNQIAETRASEFGFLVDY